MPYYRITLQIKNRRKPYQGIRQMEIWNPDTALRMVRQKALSRFRESEIIRLEVVMLPKSSDEVKNYIKGKAI